MADNNAAVSVAAAKEAVLRAIIERVSDYSESNIKELALAYRLLAGGAQPGSSIVESK